MTWSSGRPISDGARASLRFEPCVSATYPRSAAYTPAMSFRLLALLTVAGIFVAPARGVAWCQSLSVQNAIARCDQPCLTLDDFTPEQIETLGVVPLAWRRPCVEWTLHPAGLPGVARADLIEILGRSFGRWADVSCCPVPRSLLA